MRVALFVPCYVDQLRPEVGLATLSLLESAGVEVDFPREQTCCGQPLLNTGAATEAAHLARRFVEIFEDYDYIVAPSASCVATVRHHYADLVEPGPALARVAARTWEACAFLRDIVGLDTSAGRYPHLVGLHTSCHALRELRHGTASERVAAPCDDPSRDLLASIAGLELVPVGRADECCGFGGTFAIEEAAVSTLMGEDRLNAHRDAGSEIIASTDVSCLLHLEGLARRRGETVPIRHIVEIIADAMGVEHA